MALADKTGVLKLIHSDHNMFQKFTQSTTIVIHDLNKGYSCIFPKSACTVARAQDLAIPESIINQARAFIYPKSEAIPLSDVTDTKGEKITVKGVVVNVGSKLPTM